jgi:nitric oxide reductase activation protein
MLTIINFLLFFMLMDLITECLGEVFTNYFLEPQPELCPCCYCEEGLENRIFGIFQNQLVVLEVPKISEKNQKNHQNATEPNSDSEESNYEDEPSAQQENNEAEAESPSISESSKVKPPTDETHTESNGIIEAPLIPDTFEDPHDCCATCLPMPEATDADQGTDNGRNTKETSDLTNL